MLRFWKIKRWKSGERGWEEEEEEEEVDDDDDNFDDGRTKHFLFIVTFLHCLKFISTCIYKHKGRIFKTFLASLPLHMSFDLFEILRLTVWESITQNCKNALFCPVCDGIVIIHSLFLFNLYICHLVHSFMHSFILRLVFSCGHVTL